MYIRNMKIEDYNEVMELWGCSTGVGISPDDTKDTMEMFLSRNPNTSFVAVENNRIVGAIMAGHDGYRGFIHHTAVAEQFRRKLVGKQLVDACLSALKIEGIHKVVLVVFQGNQLGNDFWMKQGFQIREDLYYRDLRINE